MNEQNKSDMVIYNDGELELNVSVTKDTLWLNQAQLCDIFEKDQSVISRHINNIFKDNEVDSKSNMQKMHIANSDKPVSFYSLDIVLAVGYRTNSSKAIKFRQWATSVLKSYIQIGASLKDLGKKWFGFSKFEIEALDILGRLK
ncbi:MAG: RhuM family protein [Arcobacteraceae bacterium]